MLGLLLILMMFFVFFSLATMLGRRARRRAPEEQRRRLESAGQRADSGGQDDGLAGASPFGMMPVGSLFGQLLSSGGGWTRSLAYDETSGRWVDISDEQPERVAPAQAAEGHPDQPTRQAPRQRRRSAPTNPLQGLLGGGDQGSDFEVQPPDQLTDFDDVGGMEPLKQEVRETVGLMLQHPDDAERYGIDWNGILLHGAPGVGKTFFARAIAGEYDLNFIHVSTGDLVGSLMGQSAKNIDKAFQTGLDNQPCLLFFDEFDSVAQPAAIRPTRSRAAPSTSC
jgi:hypothetical protein